MGLTVAQVDKLLQALVGSDSRHVDVHGPAVIVHTPSPGRYLGPRGHLFNEITVRLSWIASTPVELTISQIPDDGPGGDASGDREPRVPQPPSPRTAAAEAVVAE